MDFEGTKIRKLISLGVACEVAFQLRQHSGDATSHYFDWLATPTGGLIRLIQNDFPAFRPENLALRGGGDRKGVVLDSATGIAFHHQFPRRGRVIPEDFLKDYDALQNKFDYLAARFRETVRTHPTCFVRRRIGRPDALRLEEAMRRRFPDADIRFLYVNAERETFSTPLGHSVFLPANTKGFGDSRVWARLLTGERLVELAFRLAAAQIVRSSWEANYLGDSEGQPDAILAEARRTNPENPWFAHEAGCREFARRRFSRAARLADEALERDPENLDFLELKLRAESGARRISRQAALAAVSPLLQDAARPGLWELAADLAIESGRLAEALQLVDRGLEVMPDADGLHLRRARALLASGRVEEADAAIDAALALHPAGKALVEVKAKVLCALGRADAAHALVRAVLRSKRSYRLQILRILLALRVGGRLYRRPPLAAEGSRPASVH